MVDYNDPAKEGEDRTVWAGYPPPTPDPRYEHGCPTWTEEIPDPFADLIAVLNKPGYAQFTSQADLKLETQCWLDIRVFLKYRAVGFSPEDAVLGVLIYRNLITGGFPGFMLANRKEELIAREETLAGFRAKLESIGLTEDSAPEELDRIAFTHLAGLRIGAI
jgi:hypothetical protein